MLGQNYFSLIRSAWESVLTSGIPVIIGPTNKYYEDIILIPGQ